MRARGVEGYAERLERLSLAPLTQTTKGYYIFVFSLLAVVAWGLYAYTIQLRYGLLATGMRDQVSWGFYIFNFVFWIGVSHVGAVISAILRLTHAGWRTPITRIGASSHHLSGRLLGLAPISSGVPPTFTCPQSRTLP